MSSSSSSSLGVRVLLTRTTLAHALSGALAGVMSVAITYPLDRIRVEQQTNHKEESSLATAERLFREGKLYAGLKGNVVALGTSNFVYFYWSTALTAVAQTLRNPRDRHEEMSTASSLAIAGLAGIINVLLTTPLWVTSTRLALENQKKAKLEGAEEEGLIHRMRRMAETEGWQSLWSGLGPSLLLVSNPTIQFVSFARLKILTLWILHEKTHNADAQFALDELNRETRDHPETTLLAADAETAVDFIKETAPELTGLEAFVLGGAAKFAATVATYPLQLAQTRLRSAPSHATMLSILRDVWQEKGVAGWFIGFRAKLLQTVLTSALMFLFYEKISATVFYALLRSKLKRQQ